MFGRFNGRPTSTQAILAVGLLVAVVPLSPAVGMVFVPDGLAPIAQADAAPPATDEAVSPVATLHAELLQGQAEAARQLALTQEQRRLAAERLRRQQPTTPTPGLVPATTTTTTTTTPSTTTPAPVTTAPAESRKVRALIRKRFPADQVGNAMAVSSCESGHADIQGAVNSDGTTDWGVFQLNDGGTLQGALRAIGVSFDSTKQAQRLALDTQINVRAAGGLYARSGWAPWVCAYKVGIVASLYSNEPGPMDGKFDSWGRPTQTPPDIPDVDTDPKDRDRGGKDRDRGGKPDPAPTPVEPTDPAPEPTSSPGGSPTPGSPSPTRNPSSSPGASGPDPSTSTTPPGWRRPRG